MHHLITSHFIRDVYILINKYVPDFICTHMMYIPAVYTVKTWAKFLSIKMSQYFLTQLWAGYITKCIIHKFYQYLRKKYISGELSHKSIYLLWIYNHSNWTCGRKFFISGFYKCSTPLRNIATSIKNWTIYVFQMGIQWNRPEMHSSKHKFKPTHQGLEMLCWVIDLITLSF